MYGTFKRKYLLLSAVMTMTVPVGPVAIAAEEGNDEVDKFAFEEIVVTASRRAQNLQDVPASITAVNPLEFKNSGMLNIGDVIAYTPGFSFTNLGQRGNGSITARGIGQQGSTAVVAVYVDDVAMTSNSPYSSGGNLFFDGMLGDLERVELLKGPQGTLWGASAIGGAVRYITKKPALEEIRGSASTNLSTTKDGGFNQLYNGFISLPVVEDKIGLSVAGFYEDNSGFIDLVDTATGNVVEKDADSAETYGFSGDALVMLSDNFEMRFKVMHQQQTFNGITIVDLDNDQLEPKFAPLTNDDALSNTTQKNTYFSGTLEYDFDWAAFSATSSYVEYTRVTNRDGTALLGNFADLLQGQPFGTTTAVPIFGDLSSEKYVQEARLTSQDNDKVEWLLGLFYASEKTHNIQQAIAQPTDFTMLDINFPSKYKEFAVFGNLTYYITPEFDVTAGMRYSDTKMELEQISAGPLVGPSQSFDPVNDSVSTFLFAARYRPSDNLSLYARVASGYRPAGANLPLLSPVTGLNVAPLIVEQEDIWSYEIGAKGKSSSGLFSYDMAAYYIKWSKFQAFLVLNGLRVGTNAQDGVTAKGFEGSFTLKPVDDFSVTSTIAHTDSSLNADEPSFNGLANAAMTTVPKWTFTTTARYDFTLSDDMTGHVGGGLRYTDGVSSAFVDGDAGDQQVNIQSDSYVLMDLNAGIEMDNVSLSLYVTNLLNKDAYSLASGSNIPGTSFVDGQGFPVRPRTIGAVLSFDF